MGNGARRALLFCMPEHGHLKRLLPLVAELAQRAIEVHAFVDARYAGDVVAQGAVFHDLFRNRPLAEADADSRPVPCRYVSFAAHFAGSLIDETAALGADLVIHDAFAVIGVPVAERLGLPRIHICAGHNLAPAPTLAALHEDPRVQLSDACLRAVDILRTRYGMPGASPFSYIDCLSAELNLICEPPEFLTAQERSAFEPCAFFGSLPVPRRQPPVREAWAGRAGPGRTETLRIYASLGTVVWRYYSDYARSVLAALAAALAVRPELEAIVGLGGHGAAAAALGKARPALRVEPYVDQWSVLAGADLFLTHHGLNSSHEAIWHGVPMLSCPVFSDQPGLALRCQELGLALPLVHAPRDPVTKDSILDTLARLDTDRPRLAERLALARQWELDVMAARPRVIDRIASFM